MERLDNIKLGLDESEEKLMELARRKLGKPPKFFRILRKSLDARDKNNIFWVYSVAFSSEEYEEKREYEKLKAPPKVVIVGSGPAGLMCALRLVEHGVRPIIVERGEPVEERVGRISEFIKNRSLNENSNVQFGEGGAGTFSDGKLNTQTHDSLNKDVLEYFVRFGAPEEILYLNKPHIGSDNLRVILSKMREYIINSGGEYLFNTLFTGFESKDGKLTGICFKNVKTGVSGAVQADCAVIALGHSARDTFEALASSGIYMTPRDFALGLRIEHLAENISFSQYGVKFSRLPAADYKLVSRVHERRVFTFCMCPGGVVIPAASERGGVVVNGMSEYKRNGVNSNAALMVQMRAEDFGGGLFDGMEFQRSVERRAFVAGGSDYRAPVQLVGDFLKDRVSSSFKDVKPTYSAGTSFAPLSEVLPRVAAEALKAAIPDMDRRLKGFADESAVLTGVESRFSSPIRIERDENCESLSLKGLYPCGEGSGYSGGITSSAADGIKVAIKIFEKYKNH